ncbi:uracil-DNA glycosylase [Dokdonella sp.]|uniref:uracil-DNA glycosylase n=1 Tax=Dokdonella sp. TaxID=2291710 RepID=UPI003C696BF6
MSEDRIILEPSWKQRVGAALEDPRMQALASFLRAEKAAGKTIYPRGSQIFAALDSTPFEAVKVVILGQDPYHGPGQAHGLSFSVPEGVAVPPSLQNMYKEIARDLSLPRPQGGCLSSWAEQGVLLLNAVLTVEHGKAGSHQGKGWEEFTDACIGALAEEREGVVFLLWGSYAQAKGRLIDSRRHLVLKAPHPSPLSAHRGFFGCGHFSLANRYLKQNGQTAIEWAPAAD